MRPAQASPGVSKISVAVKMSLVGPCSSRPRDSSDLCIMSDLGCKVYCIPDYGMLQFIFGCLGCPQLFANCFFGPLNPKPLNPNPSPNALNPKPSQSWHGPC